MFNSLRKHIMVKVPALQLDIKPKLLLRGLEMGVYHGYVELVSLLSLELKRLAKFASRVVICINRRLTD